MDTLNREPPRNTRTTEQDVIGDLRRELMAKYSHSDSPNLPDKQTFILQTASLLLESSIGNSKQRRRLADSLWHQIATVRAAEQAIVGIMPSPEQLNHSGPVSGLKDVDIKDCEDVMKINEALRQDAPGARAPVPMLKDTLFHCRPARPMQQTTMTYAGDALRLYDPNHWLNGEIIMAGLRAKVESPLVAVVEPLAGGLSSGTGESVVGDRRTRSHLQHMVDDLRCFVFTFNRNPHWIGALLVKQDTGTDLHMSDIRWTANNYSRNDTRKNRDSGLAN
jgi:hypothetical protein